MQKVHPLSTDVKYSIRNFISSFRPIFFSTLYIIEVTLIELGILADKTLNGVGVFPSCLCVTLYRILNLIPLGFSIGSINTSITFRCYNTNWLYNHIVNYNLVIF